MAGNRTLKLSILADVDNLRKGLNSADNDVQGFGAKLDGWASKAGVAFAAAGAAALAYAGKLAIDGVKAAIQDEAAQLKLATTLKNVTGATQAQTKAVEDYILKTELAYGVTDDELRPSLDRLVRSTKDVAEAQKLQTLALNIAAGTGKELSQVSEALARAHDGNFMALKKLGVTIDDTIVKQKNFDAATAILSNTFKDQASLQAETFDGKMRRLTIAFNETKESIGGFILDAVQPLIDAIVKYVVPGVAKLSDGFNFGLTPAIRIILPIVKGLKEFWDDLSGAIERNQDKLAPLYDLMKAVARFVVNTLAPALGTALGDAFKILGKIVGTLIDSFANLVKFLTDIFNKIKAIIDFIKNNPITNLFTSTSSATTPTIRNANFATPNVPNAPVSVELARERGSFQNIVTINGAIDPISTARQVANVLGIEATTSGSFTNLGVSFV